MLLLLVFSIISLVFSTPAHPMHLFPWSKQPTDHEVACTFVREFPLMTPKNARYRYDKCSPTARTAINQQFDDRQDHLLSLASHFSLNAHKEHQTKILQSLFEGNDIAAKKFLNMPIGKAYQLYAWSCDVFDETLPNIFQIKSIAQIFVLSKEIERAEEIIINNPPAFLGKKDMQVLSTIMQNSSLGTDLFLNQPQLQYHCHKRYTWNELEREALVTATISVLSYIPITLALASRQIALRWCTMIESPSLVQKKLDFQELTKLIQQSGKPHLLSMIDNLPTTIWNMKTPDLIDHLKCNLPNYVKINAPFFIPIPPLTIIGYFHGPLFPKTSKTPLFNSFVYGIIGTAIGAGCYILSWVPFESFPGVFAGVYVTIPLTIFAAIHAFLSGKERSWRIEKIDWTKLDQLLLRKDLMIPEKST